MRDLVSQDEEDVSSKSRVLLLACEIVVLELVEDILRHFGTECDEALAARPSVEGIALAADRGSHRNVCRRIEDLIHGLREGYLRAVEVVGPGMWRRRRGRSELTLCGNTACREQHRQRSENA